VFPKVELLEYLKGRGKEENNSVINIMNLCRKKTQGNALKTAEQYGIGEKGKEE
jgi:hypothetical protein